MSKKKPLGVSKLVKAFGRNDIDSLRQYIADGGVPNATQDFTSRANVTILTCATLYLFSEGVEFLLSVGADPNIRETAGERGIGGGTALHAAIVGSNNETPELKEERKVKIVDMLLKAGADPNPVRGGDELPLYFAARSGLLKVTQRLIDGGALVKGLPEGCITPLVGAAHNFSRAKAASEKIIHLLLDHGAAVDGDTDGGETPLMAAAFRGVEPLVELFLDRGANVNSQAKKDGQTPLTCVALYFRDAFDDEEQQLALRIASRLLAAGADPSIRNAKGESAFDIASQRDSSVVHHLNNLIRTVTQKFEIPPADSKTTADGEKLQAPDSQ